MAEWGLESVSPMVWADCTAWCMFLDTTKQNINLPIACGGGRRNNNAVDDVEPPSGTQRLGGVVPVTADDPWSSELVEDASHEVQEVQVELGGDPDASVHVRRANVDASLAHRAHASDREPSRRDLLDGLEADLALRQPNVRGHRNTDSSRLAVFSRYLAWLEAEVPTAVSGRLLRFLGVVASSGFGLLAEHRVRRGSCQVVFGSAEGVGVDRVNGPEPFFPVVSR